VHKELACLDQVKGDRERLPHEVLVAPRYVSALTQLQGQVSRHGITASLG
jgi:hypothetical protein